ncbi:acyltransferase [Clostridium sp. BL-8]|uniref:acyltransferase family protein n=1 Tax=Clostridium sp. BL-8 TaxID=349938 RepID=UPI00098C7F82|nr:acyltransferase [Clostridium sp. BL-8]OOM79440.1 acyltransferase family protein [Clostridium sp. BL-8]
MLKNYNYKLISIYRTQLMGIAILFVVFYHSTNDISSIPILSIIRKISIGSVDLFLMLSGLGLYYSNQRCRNTLHFYKKRLLRIIPIYLPVVFMMGIFYLVIGKMSISELIMNLTTLSFWFDTRNRFDWFIPAIIMLYFMTPIFLYFFKHKNKYITTGIAISCAILLSVMISSSPMQYLLIFTTRIPIFLIGILVGYWINIGKECNRASIILSFSGLILGLIIIFITSIYLKEYGASYGLWWYPFMLITLPVCMGTTIILQYIINLKVLKLTFLTFLGTHSFEIYLFHERILDLANNLSKYLHLVRYKLLFHLICFITTLIMAYIWKKIISYFLRIGRNKLKNLSIETV